MDTLLRAIAEQALRSMEVFPGAPLERHVSLAGVSVAPELATAQDAKIEVDTLLQKQTPVVLVGAPGSSKTTLLRFLVPQNARNHLAEPNAFSSPILLPATAFAGAVRPQELIQRLSENLSSLLSAQANVDSLCK